MFSFHKNETELSSLLGSRGTYSHLESLSLFKHIDYLTAEERELVFRSDFKRNVLSVAPYLRLGGYPETTIRSLLKCGLDTANYLQVKCNSCGRFEVRKVQHHCDNRFCPTCSERRRKRIFREYFPHLTSYPTTRKFSLRFLTISPVNFPFNYVYLRKEKGVIVEYHGLKGAMKKVRDDFRKFLRIKYIKERIKGGVYVIEVKESRSGEPYYDYRHGKRVIAGYHKTDSWNVHIHSVIYSRRLDLTIRGKCLDCGQSLMKYDVFGKKHYCANRSCNSTNVEVQYKDSKVVRIWKKISGSDVNIDVKNAGEDLVTYKDYQNPRSLERKSERHSEFLLNYMLKYISIDKSDIYSPENIAEYLLAIRGEPTINKFGCFHKQHKEYREVLKIPPTCSRCGSIDIEFDYILASEIGLVQDSGPPDLLLWTEDLYAMGSKVLHLSD